MALIRAKLAIHLVKCLQILIHRNFRVLSSHPRLCEGGAPLSQVRRRTHQLQVKHWVVDLLRRFALLHLKLDLYHWMVLLRVRMVHLHKLNAGGHFGAASLLLVLITTLTCFVIFLLAVCLSKLLMLFLLRQAGKSLLF